MIIASIAPFWCNVMSSSLTPQAGKSATSLGAFVKSVGTGRLSVDVGIAYAMSDSRLIIEGGIAIPTDAHLLIVNGSSSTLVW